MRVFIIKKKDFAISPRFDKPPGGKRPKGCAIKVDEDASFKKGGEREKSLFKPDVTEYRMMMKTKICKTHKMKVTLTRGSKLVACCKFDKTRRNGRCSYRNL